MHDGAGAHGTRFLGDEKGASLKSPIFHNALGLGEGKDLGVSRGILEALDLVVGSGNDMPILDDDRSHGHFISCIGMTSLTQGLAHEVIITLQVNQWVHDGWLSL